jgi:uncharacterized protein involved in exopolysaccharide biosynthesis
MQADQQPVAEKLPSSLLRDYRAVLPLYLRVCAVVVGVVLVVSFIMPASYKATTTIMPPDEKESAGSLSALMQASPINLGSLGGSGKLSLVYLEILQSRTLLEGVVDTLHLTKSPLFSGMDRDEIVGYLSKRIDVETKKTGSVVVDVELSSSWFPFVGSSADEARASSATVANACRSVLDRLNHEKSTSKARSTRAYIERVMEATKLEIRALQDSMQAFQDSNKVIALDDQMAALVNHAVTIGTELATAELELAMVRQDYSPNSPQVVLLEKKVSALREQYDRVQRGGLVDSDGFSIPFSEVPQLTRTYTNLVRDLKIKEQINAYLESQRMEQIIQEAKDVPTVVVLDEAIEPTSRSSPSRVLGVALALIVVTLAFLVGVPVRSNLLRDPG